MGSGSDKFTAGMTGRKAFKSQGGLKRTQKETIPVVQDDPTQYTSHHPRTAATGKR